MNHGYSISSSVPKPDLINYYLSSRTRSGIQRKLAWIPAFAGMTKVIMLANQTSVKLSVIIPNWNGKHLLKICLPSLKKQTFKNFEVVIVDNGSKDGSIEYIEKYYPEIKLIKLENNIGFAPAVNLGLKICVGEMMVLLNNDTEVDKNCLQNLLKVANKKDIGFVAAKILNFKNRKLIDSAGDYIDAVGHADNNGRGETDGTKFSTPGPLFLATAGGSLFKREVFEKIGFFDHEYFAYMEDVDFCLRAQLNGIKGWYEPSAVIYHIHKATSSKNPGFTEYLQYRNMTLTVLKNFPKELFLKDLNWLKVLLVNINTIRYLATIGYLKEALKAEWYILKNLPRILKKRSEIQNKINVPVDYILKNIRPKKITFFGIIKNGI